jgi:iron-sulfur cluster assembly protein
MVPVLLTDNAVEALKKILSGENLPANTAVRLGVKGGGSSGFSYAMGFDERAAMDDDETFEVAGIRLYIDKKCLQYIDGVEVDYLDDLKQRGFVFNNPNGGGCGCGS